MSKSQSALEYMMTYGWAILVIVIVAGVLYSLGIFSPSSAISATVTGFSNLGSVTAQCIGNQGLTIQLGDSVGYTIQIMDISVSANGKTVSMPEQTDIAPSGSKVFYISNVCPSPSSRYSLSVTVDYTEPGQIFPGPYTSTGTITGSSSKQQISSTPAFNQIVPITITNSQDNSTSNPYQQMVIVPSSVYGGYAASNFQNVEFFYSNGSIISSWLENYTNTNATWWLKLSSISASSSKTVYMGFVSKSTNLFNTVNDGEAPQIPCGSTSTSSCSNYAEYDDGANVFNNYWNFAGTSLPSGLNSGVVSGSSITVDNGLNISGNGETAGSTFVATNLAVFSSNEVLEGYINQGSGLSNGERGLLAVSTVNNAEPLWDNGGGGGDTIAGWSAGRNNVVDVQSMTVDNGAYTYLQAIAPNSNWVIYGLYLSSGVIGTYVNYGSVTSTTSNVATNLPYINLGVITGGALSPFNQHYQWLRVRAYPPNGVMPSVSFGYSSNITKPANIQSYAPITISNNQNVSVSNFQQMINVPSSVFAGYANTASGTAFQNLEFFYANGTVIPSWLENYTSSNALYWIKLPSVPAETSFTVYLGFATTSTNLFNTVNDGEAPQISSTYAEYDDGVDVFNNYENFAGSGLPSGWQELTSSGDTYTWDKGITFTNAGPGGYVSIGTTSAVSPSGILELGITSGSNARPVIELATSSTQIMGVLYMYENGYGQAYGMYSGDMQFQEFTTSYSDIPNGKTNYNAPIIEGVAWTATGSQILEIIPNYNYRVMETVSETNTAVTLSTPLYIVIGLGSSGNGANTGSFTANWLRVRAYPPNGVMPSVTFGSVS